MDETQTTHKAAAPWRWIILGLALGLTIIWLLLTPRGLLGKASAVGYAVCHQIEERSFHIHEAPFPLCARCSGLFLGAVLGLAYQVAQGRKGKMPPLWPSILFGALALAWVFDGLNSFSMLVPAIPSLYQTQNWTRLVTGTGMGLAVSAVLWPAFVQTMFNTWEDQSALGNWKQILGLMAAGSILVVLVLMEISWVLYPLALLGAGGVVTLLTMVYSVALVMLFKRDNTYARFSQLVLPLVGGYSLGLLQVGAISLVRFMLTGTWDGFSL
jgi:uncharacterized membrane protein